MSDRIVPPTDGRHVTSTTPRRCERWIEDEEQYVTVYCTKHSALPPGTVEPPRQTPACGNLKPHAPHNGFGTSNPEPWCKGVPDDGASEVLRMQRKLESEIAKAHEAYRTLEGDFNAALNARDTYKADLSHMKRWCSVQLKKREGELLSTGMNTTAPVGELIGLAGQMRALKSVLAELSRLENT